MGDAGGESGDAYEGGGAGAFGACAEGAFDGGDEALEPVLEDVMGGAFPDGREGALFPSVAVGKRTAYPEFGGGRAPAPRGR